MIQGYSLIMQKLLVVPKIKQRRIHDVLHHPNTLFLQQIIHLLIVKDTGIFFQLAIELLRESLTINNFFPHQDTGKLFPILFQFILICKIFS